MAAGTQQGEEEEQMSGDRVGRGGCWWALELVRETSAAELEGKRSSLERSRRSSVRKTCSAVNIPCGSMPMLSHSAVLFLSSATSSHCREGGGGVSRGKELWRYVMWERRDGFKGARSDRGEEAAEQRNMKQREWERSSNRSPARTWDDGC